MISGLAIPIDVTEAIRVVRVNERDVRSYYPYVDGGPAEGAHLQLNDQDFVGYVNTWYATFGADRLNPRMTGLFELAGVGMSLNEIRGDGLLVLGPGRGDSERSVPAAWAQALAGAG